MATHHGKAGTVKTGSNTIAEIQDFSIEENLGTADDTAMGDDWDTHLNGTKNWKGELMCSWDETDTNGQEALTIGASFTGNFYPEGAGSGATYKTGTATVERILTDVKRGSVVTRSFTFKGNGSLSTATV